MRPKKGLDFSPRRAFSDDDEMEEKERVRCTMAGARRELSVDAMSLCTQTHTLTYVRASELPMPPNAGHEALESWMTIMSLSEALANGRAGKLSE